MRYFLALWFVMSLQAEIMETSTHRGTEEWIDQETWVLIDLDNCLYQATREYGHSMWFDQIVKQKMDEGCSKSEAIDLLYPTWMEAQEGCPIALLEPSFKDFIAQLQDQGIVVMAITHRQPRGVHIALRQIQEVGCDFRKNPPGKESFSLHFPYPTLYQDGVLFVHDMNPKGPVFSSFCEKIGKKPKKIVFFDDKRKNVESLEESLSVAGVEYLGIHYTAIYE